VNGAFSGGPGGENQKTGLWMKGYGLFSHESSVSAAPGFNATAGGVVVGGQWAVNKRLTLGAALNYAQINVDFANADGLEQVSQFKGAAYARYQDGDVFLRGLVGVSSNRYDVARIVDPMTTAEGKYSGTGAAGFAEGGKAFGLSPDTTITPSLRLGYIGTRLGGFEETGADGLDLTVNSANLDAFSSLLGVKAEHRFALGEGSQLIGALSLGWEHQFLQTAESVDATYAIGPTHVISGNALPRDGAVVSAKIGGEALARVRYFIGYEVKITGTYTEQTAGAGFKITF
jgi:outer membrane autotransporter protein